jgi:hypothetical protein
LGWLERPLLLIVRTLGDPLLEDVFSAAVSFLCDFGGGITSSLSSLTIRSQASLFVRSPGTIARTPSISAVAPSDVLSLSVALRVWGSKPWQAKHLSERIGRTSRLNPIVAHSSPALPIPAPTLRYRRRAGRTASVRRTGLILTNYGRCRDFRMSEELPTRCVANLPEMGFRVLVKVSENSFSQVSTTVVAEHWKLYESTKNESGDPDSLRHRRNPSEQRRGGKNGLNIRFQSESWLAAQSTTSAAAPSD